MGRILLGILSFLFFFILILTPKVNGQEVVLPFNEGFLGELGNNKCVTNCEYTSTLGITNLRFGQVNDTGQFTSPPQGNDILGFVKFSDSNGDEYQINGFINWRITNGSTPRAFGFIPDNTSTVTIQTTAGAFNIYGSSQDTGTTPTSTFGFILEGQTVTVADGESEGGNAAQSTTVDNLNTELDKQPRIIISDVTVNEGDGTATVTVSFDPGNGADIGASPAPTEESTVEYSIQDSTAQAGSDYSTVSGTLTFPSGSTASQTFTIPITDDTIIEEDEFIIALLSNPTGDLSITDNKGIVTILDNDTEQPGDLTLTLT